MKFSGTALLISIIGVSAFCDVVIAASDSATNESQDADRIAEIVVTAQKRSQSINDVGMSINALTGDQLATAGFNDPSDLMRVIPGFTFTKTGDEFPIYSIRGIGYYDNNPSATPAVTVYVDEVPVPYPLLTQGVALDVQRVEVLKGPQGTLFGQNSTGGAINFIAAKPTTSFDSGGELSYGRFNAIDFSGFVSGPISETLTVRVATRVERADAWQYSYTRNDTIGKTDREIGRLLIDWTPTPVFDAELNINGWVDQSDPQMGQLAALAILLPGLQNPGLATGDGSPGNPIVQTYPAPPHDPRAADWTPGHSYAKDNKYWQAAVRANFHMTDTVTLTSISSFQNLNFSLRNDTDGTALTIIDIHHAGFIQAASQELRLSGQHDRLQWMIGGNYFWSYEHSFVHNNYTDLSAPLGDANIFSDTQDRSIAAFENAEYKLTDQFSVVGGLRYTHNKERLTGCEADSGDGAAARFFNFVDGTNVFKPGQCYSLDNIHYNPAVVLVPSPADDILNEHNVSWRIGPSYTPNSNTLIYANISKGYKAGAHTLATATVLTQFAGVSQESVLGYEIGLKVTPSRNLHLNGAVFYYDYANKQLDAPYNTGPPFGIQDKLQNIPKSRITGAELEIISIPLRGLTLRVNGTYLDSKVLSDYFGFDPFGNALDIKGEAFPFTPKWQVVSDADYRFGLTETLSGLIGVSNLYRSKTTSNFGSGAAFHSVFDINSYSLFDLRAGVETEDGKWRVQVWGRNVANKYYRVNTSKLVETVIGDTGMPATFGVSLQYRYH